MILNRHFNGKRVLITGHTGFKGSWLAIWLNQLGADVTGISLDVPSIPSHFETSDLANRIYDNRLDIRNGNELKKTIKRIQPDFVFHLAAQALVRPAYADPVSTYETNLMGTINVLESLRDIQNECTAVFITSDKCYDNVEWEWGYRETDALGGSDPYSASKGAAELAIRSYIKSYFQPSDSKARIAVGRAGNVIGGGDWAADRIVPDCVRAWSANETVQLRNPHATRPWQHVLEPLSGYLNLAMELSEKPELHGQPFNFGPPSENNHTVMELVKEMGKHWSQIRWDDISGHHGGPYESGLLKLNCDKALHHLRWKTVLDFESTVKLTAEWYKHYYSGEGNIYEYTSEQIDFYLIEAKRKGHLWAM